MKRYSGFIVAAVFAGIIGTWAAGLTIRLPNESGVFTPGEHADLANAQCLVCHSIDYITTQPPLPRTYWRATVVKMQDKYGAPIPNEQVDPLADYLARHYGTNSAADIASTNSSQAVATNLTAALPALEGSPSGSRSVVRHGCTGCHQPDTRVVGPGWKQIAAKYRGDAQAPSKLADQITHGGAGKWGPIPMPPFPKISAEEVKSISAWILNLPQ